MFVNMHAKHKTACFSVCHSGERNHGAVEMETANFAVSISLIPMARVTNSLIQVVRVTDSLIQVARVTNSLIQVARVTYSLIQVVRATDS